MAFGVGVYICLWSLFHWVAGYNITIVSGALPFLITDFRLSEFEQGIVVSSILVGCTAGSMYGGILANRFGRKKH